MKLYDLFELDFKNFTPTRSTKPTLIGVFRKTSASGMAKIYVWKVGPDQFELESPGTANRIPVNIPFEKVRQSLQNKGFNESRNLNKEKRLIEAHINQQMAFYSPDNKTYRGEKMPDYDPNDIFSKYEQVPTNYEEFEAEPDRDQDEDAALKRVIQKSLSELPPKWAQVLKMRFLDGMTLEQCAAKLGVIRERVRQIEAKALSNLRRKPSLSTDLKPFLKNPVQESTKVSTKEKVLNPGVEVGKHVYVQAPGFESIFKAGKFLRIGPSGLATVLLNAPLESNGERRIAVPPSWLYNEIPSAFAKKDKAAIQGGLV